MSNSARLHSKFAATYSKLLQGQTPSQINPNEDTGLFFSNLLSLEINREFLVRELNHLPRESFLGHLNVLTFNTLFQTLLSHGRSDSDPSKRGNAFQTLIILTRCLLSKNLSGWEIMEIFAGGTSKSDTVFMQFTGVINEVLVDPDSPANIRHQALQLALVFMCGVGQLSPGAYFLRRDLFPSLVTFMKTPETEQYTFEAVLLLAILANFHKSDAGKLNPYLQRIKVTEDPELMGKICWAAGFALETAVKAYQEIHNDEPAPTFTTTLGSLLASMRPDRALASSPVDSPRELFKNQPIEACAILSPIYEFLRSNASFNMVFLETIVDEDTKSTPIPFTVLTLSSYLLTHATTTSSPRSLAYANLSLNCLLAFVENERVLEGLCKPNKRAIRLCRQRPPLLPTPKAGRAPVCALLDCCVLWLRHNLHKRLEVHGYSNCILICYRTIYYLSQTHTRLEYEWKELWISVIGLLNFFATKLESLYTTGGVETLIRETVDFLDLSLIGSSSFLPTPRSLHEFVYELVRTSVILEKQVEILRALATPMSPSLRTRLPQDNPESLLSNLLTTVRYYEEKITSARVQSANQGMRIIEREIDRDGLVGPNSKATKELKVPMRTDEVVGFSRIACVDGLALMP
uniref:Putative conserved protein UP6 n=1 Tax=Moniliophthora roreri TaxID=221103 RepID=A0A0W0FAR2_MONRR